VGRPGGFPRSRTPGHMTLAARFRSRPCARTRNSHVTYNERSRWGVLCYRANNRLQAASWDRRTPALSSTRSSQNGQTTIGAETFRVAGLRRSFGRGGGFASASAVRRCQIASIWAMNLKQSRLLSPIRETSLALNQSRPHRVRGASHRSCPNPLPHGPGSAAVAVSSFSADLVGRRVFHQRSPPHFVPYPRDQCHRDEYP
jgi:hypothetical protein